MIVSEEETWVTIRHGAELAHCPPSLVEQLVSQGILSARLVPNPHGVQFAPMRLVIFEHLSAWLKTHPTPASGRVHPYSSGPATRLRHVSAQLRNLADQRPWVTLLLILLHWEGDPARTQGTLQAVLPALWDASQPSERSWQGGSLRSLVRFDFASVGYAQFVSPWTPTAPPQAGGTDLPYRTEGLFYGRMVGPREPARYPPAVLLNDMNAALATFQSRWF